MCDMLRFMRPKKVKASVQLLPESAVVHYRNEWTFAHKRCKGVWRTYSDLINNDEIHGASNATA